MARLRLDGAECWSWVGPRRSGFCRLTPVAHRLDIGAQHAKSSPDHRSSPME